MTYVKKILAVVSAFVLLAQSSYAAVSYTPHSTVNPGDSITSDAWNDIVTDLNTYNQTSGTGLVRTHDSGEIGIGTSTISTDLLLDVEGKVGATEYCDEDGGDWA